MHTYTDIQAYTDTHTLSQLIFTSHLQVKKILAVLITHHIVKFNVNKKGLIEYNISIKAILSRVRFPNYICTSKTLYGDAAELLVEELLQRGEATMETVVNKVTERLNEALEASGNIYLISTFSSA